MEKSFFKIIHDMHVEFEGKITDLLQAKIHISLDQGCNFKSNMQGLNKVIVLTATIRKSVIHKNQSANRKR